jgi:hypothetical protein
MIRVTMSAIAGALLSALLVAGCTGTRVETVSGSKPFAGDQPSTPPSAAPAAAAAAPAAAPAASDTGYGLRAAKVDYLSPAAAGSPMGLPPNAKPGECYVNAVVPAQYEAVKERVLKKAAATRIEVAPAQIQDTEERVLVKPASKRLEAVPATFEEVEERVLVKPASKRLEVVPATLEEVEERVLVSPATQRIEPVAATFKTETERVVVRPAYTVWKRSSELTAAERAQQKIDPSAGDILCLVEVPAEYSTVTRQVIDQAATTRGVEVPAEYATVKKTVVKTPEAAREVEIPAEYATVKKTVMKTPPTTREIEVPAEYKVVTVKKVVTPAKETQVEIPAEYDEVTRQVLKAPATSQWVEILCDTNATPQTLVSIQQALKREGFDPGREDGRVDDRTMSAVQSFQRARNLPFDSERYINMATVKALGVTP